MPYFRSLLFIALALLSSIARANCSSMEDDNQRLACYDTLSTDESAEGFEPLDARIAIDNNSEERRFSIASHKPNYLLPLSYNFDSTFDDYGALGDFFSDAEIKFQISIKAAALRGLWHDSTLWLAYTQKSYWQLYADSEASSPFRETNHEPEVLWDIPLDVKLPAGISARRAWLTFTHESNGRAEPLSRSWNRVSGTLMFERKRIIISAQTWLRIKEKTESDDNPNIEDYLGRVQLGIIYKGKHNTMTLNVKNNLRQENRSGIEFSWSRPIKSNFKWYVQAYSGYGENLIDMENHNNRLSFGVALTDWL